MPSRPHPEDADQMRQQLQPEWEHTSPQQFLLATRRGAYTTLRVRRSSRAASSSSSDRGEAELELVDWSTHLERLVRSLRALHTALGGYYSRYYAWLEGISIPEPAALQQQLAPAIRAVLAAALQAHAATQHLMLILVLPPSPDQPCGLDVRALARPCAPPGSSPCTALVLGGPRSVPEGKDSGWVADRQPLEQLRAASANADPSAAAAEVILSSADGRLLEGLVTNLFVVTSGAPRGGGQHGSSCCAAAIPGAVAEGAIDGTEGCCDSSAGAGAVATSATPSAPVVWTAGMQDGVVWGTARQRVLQACRQLGYAVREEAPSMRDRQAWSEAFLTNSLRLVQPVERIACSGANVVGLPSWEVDFGATPGPVTAELAAALPGLLPACCASNL